MGSGEILAHINEFLSQINKYFNPIGKFYIQVQVLCRVLVCSVFLDDLFKSSALECETKQVGCTQNCVNRFAPLNHKKIWELELFMVMLAIVIFLAFNLYNEHVINKARKKTDREFSKNDDEFRKNEITKSLARKSMRRKEKKGKEFYKSPFTSAGYIFMLLFRLSFEIFFCWLENQLGKHQSQNVEFWNSFWLKESWQCATNSPKEDASAALNRMIPPANRTEVFWTDDHNLACLQQEITVTCWIPFSRMKSYGLLFMYWVLLINTLLTFLELVFELTKLCRGSKSSNSNNNSSAPQNQMSVQSAPIINNDYNTADTLKVADSDSKARLMAEAEMVGENIVKIYPDANEPTGQAHTIQHS